jgi:hypothetical protein
MEHKQIELEAELLEILAKLGISTEAKTTDILKTIILSAVTEAASFDLDDQYDKIGRAYQITRERVRQIVCHTIGNHWNRESLNILSDHFGHAVSFRERREGEAPNGAGKPTNGAFVEMLAEHLRQKYDTDNKI